MRAIPTAHVLQGVRGGKTAAVIEAFFKCVRSVLNPGGVVMMGLVDSRHYNGLYQQWKAARAAELLPVSILPWDKGYNENGYRHRETKQDVAAPTSHNVRRSHEACSIDQVFYTLFCGRNLSRQCCRGTLTR
jgi:hypothetical protein